MQSLDLGFLDVKKQVQAVDRAFYDLGDAARTFQTNLNTRVSAPLLAVSASFSKVSESLQGLSKSLTGIADNVNTAFQALYSPKKTKQDALTGGLQTSMKKLHKIFEDLVDISKMDVDSKFSKMSSGIMNISKALAGFQALQKIDLGNVEDQIVRVKEIINSIQIVGSKSQAGSSGADTRAFIDSSVIALQDIGKSITAFGTGIQTFISDPSLSSILEDAPRLSTMMTSIQSIFETMSGMYKGVQQTILKEDKDGTLTVSTKIQQAVDSRTRALARVSSLLPKFAKAVHQYSVYSKSDTDLALSNIHRFKISVQSLFKAMYGLYGSLIQYTQYGSGEQGYAQEKMVQNFNSATKAMSRVISLLREFNLTILEMAVFDDKDLKKAQATMQQMSRSVVGLFTTMKGLYKSLRQTTQFQDKSTGQTFIQQKQIQDFSYATKAVSRVLSLIGTMTNHVKNVSGLDTSKFSSMLAQIQNDLVNFVGTLAKITNLPSFPKFQRLANAMQKVSKASKNLVTATQKSQKALKKLNNTAGASLFSLNRLHPAIRQIFTAFAGYNLIYSAVRALQASVKSMAKLQLAMARVNTITRQSSAVIKQWTKQVINLSARYGVDLQHVSEALYQINSATILGANAFKVLEAATKAAVAGFTDVNKTASLLARAINAYGYSANDAGRLSDILFKTVQRGIVPMQQLSQYMGRIFTVAANAGVSFQQVSAAIATLTTRGLQTNIAVTSLNSAILKLSQGSQALNALFKEQGYTSSASALQIEGLGGAMRVLLNATNGSTEALTKLGFNYRDIRAVSVLASGAFQQLTNNMELMQKASGATDKALEQVKDTLSWKWDQFRKSLDAFILRFNEWANSSSILKGIVDALSASLKVLQDLLNGFSSPVVSGLMFVGQFVLLTKLVPKISSGMKSIGESIKTFKGYVADARTELQLLQKNSAPKKRQYRVVHTDTPYSGKSKDYAPVWTQQQISMRMKRDAAHMQLENLRKSGQLKGLSEKAVLKAYKDMSTGITPNIVALKQLSKSTKKSSISFGVWTKAVGKSIKSSAFLKQALAGLSLTLVMQVVMSIATMVRSVSQLQQSQKNLTKPFKEFRADLTQVNNAMSSAVAQFSGFGGSIQQRSKQLPFLNKVTDDLSGSISNLQQQCKSAREQGKIVSGQTLVSLQMARNKLQAYIEKIQQFKAQVRSLSAQQRQQYKNSVFIQDIKNTAVQLRNGKQNSNASYYQALRRKQQLKNSIPGLDLSILQHTPEAFDIAAKSAIDAGADFGKLHKVSRQYLDILQKLQKVSNKQLDNSMRDSLTFSSMSVQDYMYKLEKQGQLRFNKNYGFSYQDKSSDFWNTGAKIGLSKEALSFMKYGVYSQSQHSAEQSKYMRQTSVLSNFFDQSKKQYEDLGSQKEALQNRLKLQQQYYKQANEEASQFSKNWGKKLLTAWTQQGLIWGSGNKQGRQTAQKIARQWLGRVSETSAQINNITQSMRSKQTFTQKSVSSKVQSYFKNITDPTAKLHMQAAKLKAGIVSFSDASVAQLRVFTEQFNSLQESVLDKEFAKKTFQTQVTRIKAVEGAMIEGGLEKASKTFDSVFNMQRTKQIMGAQVVERAKAQILGKIQKNIQNFGANYKDIIEDIDSGMSEQFIIGKYAKNLSGDVLQKFIQSVRDQRKAREDWFNRASQALSQNTASMVKLRNINVLSDRAVKYAKDKVKQIESQMFTGADGTKRSFDEIQKMFDRNRQIGISDAQTTQQLQESGVIQKEQMARLTGAMLNWSKHMTVVVDFQQVDEKNKQIKIPEAIQAQTAMAVGSSQFIHTLMSQTTKTPEQVALDSINKSVKRITKYVTQTDGSIAVVYA